MTAPRPPRSRRSVGITTTAVAVAVGVVLVVVAVVVWWAPWRPTVVVPNATNVYPAQAQDTVERAGLKVLFPLAPAISDADTGINGYAISQQSPAAGLASGEEAPSPSRWSPAGTPAASHLSRPPASWSRTSPARTPTPPSAFSSSSACGSTSRRRRPHRPDSDPAVHQPGTSVKQGTHIELHL